MEIIEFNDKKFFVNYKSRKDLVIEMKDVLYRTKSELVLVQGNIYYFVNEIMEVGIEKQ